MATDIRYDVDSVSDLKLLISKDSSIASSDIIKKIFSYDNEDLLLVTKAFSGALIITDVSKVDPNFILESLK